MRISTHSSGWLIPEHFSQSVVEKSTALYEQLVSEEIIPEMKRESGHEWTSEALNQIETHWGHKNDALTSKIETTQGVKTRKTLRKERSKVRQSKKAIQDFKDRKLKYDKQMEIYGDIPEYIVADAGYGSEYNYTMILDEFEKTPLITYSMHLKEKQRKYKNNPLEIWRLIWVSKDYRFAPNQKLSVNLASHSWQ